MKNLETPGKTGGIGRYVYRYNCCKGYGLDLGLLVTH